MRTPPSPFSKINRKFALLFGAASLAAAALANGQAYTGSVLYPLTGTIAGDKAIGGSYGVSMSGGQTVGFIGVSTPPAGLSLDGCWRGGPEPVLDWNQ